MTPEGVRRCRAGLLTSYAIVVRYIDRVGLGERDVFRCPLAEQRVAIGVAIQP